MGSGKAKKTLLVDDEEEDTSNLEIAVNKEYASRFEVWNNKFCRLHFSAYLKEV